MRNYLPLLSLAFGLGIVLGQRVYLSLITLTILALAFCLIAYVSERPQLKAVVFLAVFFMTGAIWGRGDLLYNTPPVIIQTPANTSLVLEIGEKPQISSSGLFFPAQVINKGDFFKQKILVKVKDKEHLLKLRRGDLISARGTVTSIEEPRNPGGFDFKKYYYIRNVYFEMGTLGYNVQVKGYREVNVFLRLCDDLRQKAEDTVRSTGDSQSAAVFLAMMTGDKTFISQENITLFQDLGLMHLFAISGLNVGIIVIILLYFTSRLRLDRKWEFGILFVILLLYAGVASFSVSVLRAVMMALFYAFARIISRDTTPVIAIFLTALILLIYNPRLTGDVGFLLTFGCIFGIVYFQDIFTHLVRGPWDSLFMPISAQLLILPILLTYFHNFGWVVLLMAVPATILAFPITISAFLTIFLAPLGGMLAKAAAVSGIMFTKLLIIIAQPSHILPYAVGHFPSPLAWQIVLYYSVLLIIYLVYYFDYLTVKKVVFLLIILPVILMVPQSREGVKVTLIDVGQGDAILVELPNGHNMLIDTGGSAVFPDNKDAGSYDVGAKIVLPVLYSKGIDQLDGIFITHPHADHTGGLDAIFKGTTITRLYISPYQNEISEDVLKSSIDKKIPHTILTAGAKFKDGDVILEILGPVKTYKKTHSDANNSSLVIKMTYGKETLLLTGDIEDEAMDDIGQSRELTNVIFFKVPHHGSHFSLNEKFLSKVSPTVAMVSVGTNNLFGHPAKQTMDYYNAHNVTVLRTDRDGAIEILVHKESAEVKTYLSKKKLRVK